MPIPAIVSNMSTSKYVTNCVERLPVSRPGR
jgi:hypothetical protein